MVHTRIPDIPAGEHIGPPEEIAGIAVIHISDEPPENLRLSEEGLAFSERMARRYDRAEEDAQTKDFESARSFGDKDGRTPTFALYTDEPNSPFFSFLLNRQTLAHIQTATAQKGAELSQDELLRIGLEEGSDAVNPTFSADAMNAINASYYGSEVAFDPNAKLADIFATNRPINRALGALLTEQAGHPDQLRVKELCSGRNIGHWQYIAEGALTMGTREVDVTLSDFVVPPIDTWPGAQHVRLSAEQYSLLGDMPPLPDDQKFDAMITTYGFDSVWQQEDLRLTLVDDTWFQTLYRVKVADWNPRREELLEAMRDGRPLPNAAPQDYDGIVVEKAMTPINLTDHPYRDYIIGSGRQGVAFPGGLIKRIVNAYQAQLQPNGVFVCCDTGEFGLGDKAVPTLDAAISGIAARYRQDNFLLAKQILEQEYGLEVSLFGRDRLVDTYLPADWQQKATDREIEQAHRKDPSNGVLVVKRAA